MTISTVSNTSTITSSTYNSIQSLSASILTDLYGNNSSSIPLTAGPITITADQWQRLYSDISRSSVHQTNQVPTYPAGSYPDVNDLSIRSDFVNSLIANVQTVAANTGSHHPNQLLLATTSTGATYSKRTTQWGSTLTHRVNYNWNSQQDAEHFFNLGGKMVVQEGYVPGTGNGGTTDTNWMSMIDWANSQLQTAQYQFTATNWYSNTVISLTTSSDLANVLSVRMLKRSSNSTQLEVNFNHVGSQVSLNLVSTATFVYSRGDTIPPGVPAPRPTMSLQLDLGDGGVYVPFSKILSLPYLPGEFFWYAVDPLQPTNTYPGIVSFPDAAFFPNATYSYDGTTVTLVYDNPGNYSFSLPYGIPNINATIIAVGGGGGGSSYNQGCNYGASNSGGGGGGSGGYESVFYALSHGNYSIQVGQGGSQGNSASACYYGTSGSDGQDSYFQTITASGGTGATTGWEYNGGPSYGGNQQNGIPGTRNGGYGGLPAGNDGEFGGNQGNPVNGAGGASPYGGYGAGGNGFTPGVTTGNGNSGVIIVSFDFSPRIYFYADVTTEVTASPVQTLNLKNIGYGNLTISDINYTTNGSTIAPVYSYTFDNFPVTIPANSVESMYLSYSGTQPGTFNSSFTIISDNDTGPITVLTNQVVSVPSFNINILPTSVSTVSNTALKLPFSYTTDGYNLASYSASLSNTTGFSINNTNYGPQVLFDPSGLPINNTYITNMSVIGYDAYGVSATTSTNISVLYTSTNAISGSNLGGWFGPFSSDNSVVGISYDIIGSTRYITIGVGAGGDGGPSALNGGAAALKNGTKPKNLDYLSDTGYSNGMVLYPIVPSNGYCAFLNFYGASIAYNTGSPAGVGVSRSYTFNVSSVNTYLWSFSVADRGYFKIDNNLVSDLRYVADPYQTEHVGNVLLSTGIHTITIYSENDSDAGGVALTIRDPSTNDIIWSTRTPVRSSPPYQYWQEVYRVPLTKGAATYYSADYYIKNSLSVNKTNYGGYFQNGSIFNVTDDGFGNISIAFRNVGSLPVDAGIRRTVVNLPYSPYYYLPGNVLTTRQTQLDISPIGNGSETHYFLGFDNLGNTVTSVVRFPTKPATY